MDEIRYDDRTALLVVDVQNDFADPGGSLYVEGGENVVPLVNREVDRARSAGAAVIYTRDWHPPETPHFEKHGGKWPVHCVRETWGAEYHPDLEVAGDQIRKATGWEDGYSGFSVQRLETGDVASTGLEEQLHERGIERVVIVGLATDYCVKETGLDAVEKGFDATVLRDAVRAVDVEPGDGERTLEELEQAGVKVV
ncbi:MAG: isochorismatase family protein [Acidimicrobiia bacterium]